MPDLAARLSAPRTRPWVLVVYWVVMFGMTHWPEIQELSPGLSRIPGFDKYVHFAMYTGWAIAWAWVLTAFQRPLTRGRVLAIALGGACYAVFDELTQALVDRDPEWLDLCVDILGIATGLLLARRVYRHLAAARDAVAAPGRT